MSPFHRKHSITTLDLVIYFRQFATLLSAGIPLIQCCNILECSQQNKKLSQLIFTLKYELLSGKTLSQAIENHQEFDVLTRQLIYIGEQTGNLDGMLTSIANHKEKNYAFQQRIKQALFYPLFVLCTGFIVTISMFIFIIPRFIGLFDSAQIKLPVLTLFIFQLSQHLQHYIIYYLLFIVIITFYLKPMRHFQPKHFFRKLLYKHEQLRKIILARFARNLACAFAAGISVTESINLIASTIEETEFIIILYQVRQQLNTGLSFYYSLTQHSCFPPYMRYMVKIGEETGNLEHMLIKIAEFYEADIDRFVQRCSQLLEPLIMLGLGVLIGGLVIGMYLPIFNLGSTL